MLAGLALVLAGIGIYGIMAYATAQRTREFGIRIALGAQRSDIFSLVVRSGFTLMLLGLAIGLPAAYAVTPLLGSLITGVQPHDAATFAAVSVVLFAVALLASGAPARRAMQLDPAVTLRAD